MADDEEDRRVLSRASRPPDGQWAYGSAADQVADLYLPASGAPALRPVVLVHGGFWRPEYDRAHLRPMSAALADAGYPVLSLEYRRIPGDPDATIDDVLSAVAALPQALAAAGLPPRTACLVGHSAGGHIALLVAAASAPWVDSCLALAPAADLELVEELGLDDGAVTDFLGAPARRRPDLDPARLAAPTIPITLVHGDDDTLVPLSVSRSYAGDRHRLVVIDDCGHFELIDPGSRAWSVVMAELAGLGLPSGGPDGANQTAVPRSGIE